jgi:hypothetical protein
MSDRPNNRAPEYREADGKAAADLSGLPSVRARQGVTGHNGRYVLGFGLAAVILAFIVVYFIYIG